MLNNKREAELLTDMENTFQLMTSNIRELNADFDFPDWPL